MQSFKYILFLFFTFTLSACGGGGGGSTTTPTTPTPTTTTHSISGTISGVVVSGVTVALSGAGNATATTDSSGNYTFSGLVAGNYTVAPTLSGYTFSPAQQSVSLSDSADQSGINFSETANATTHSISGTVSGDVMAGVTITVTGGGLSSPATATTDSSGNYTVPGLNQSTYTVTPSLSGYIFNPSSSSVPVSSSADSTGNNFTATASAAATYSISGTVTGPWVGGITMTLAGAGSASATTAIDGTYSFSGLVAGTYTVTPSLSGYNYSPAAPSIILGADTSQDFTGSSAVTSSSISGTLTYSGSKTGGGAIRVFSSGCTAIGSCDVIAATHIPPQSGAFTYAYTIRGIPTGTYVVKAGFNPVNTGAPNIANPGGTSASVSTTPGTDYTGVDITITDPASIAAPTTPSIDKAVPGDQSVLIAYSAPTDVNGKEIADSYKVYWSTDSTFATGVSTKIFPAYGTDPSIFMLGGLNNGDALYFKMSAINHDTSGAAQESAATSFGPLTVGAATGANTVTGSVSYTGTATGPMIVGMFDATTGNLYYTRVASVTSNPQPYTLSGVPTGSNYFNFAIIDNNNNGVVDTGDFQNILGNNSSLLAVSGATTSNVTLSGNNSDVLANTNHTYDGSTNSYSIIGGVINQVKKAVHLVLFSGPNVAVPYDMDYSSGAEVWMYVGNTAPNIGDTYKYKVFYSDGTNETRIASVSAVLSTSNMVSGVTGVTDGSNGSSAGVPYFSWTAPATPLGSFTYTVGVNGTGLTPNIYWYTYNDLPSSAMGALYNFDGTGSPTSLSSGDTMDVRVNVWDSNENSGTQIINYTVP